MAHTPGPWTAHNDDGTGTLPCVLAEQVTTYGNFYVAQCNVYGDARLIAAAPDLLAELSRLYEAARCMADPEHCLHSTLDYLPWKELADQAKAAIAKAVPQS